MHTHYPWLRQGNRKVGRSLDPVFQPCLGHTFSLEPEGVMT
ncbi:hypothetical protein GCM10007171_43080 [Dickeya fangzhongdai]|nr:hypothetical protein GCM10007171_43080 [Dickeya fangzhongdai]